jgi:hypothetical protein
MEASNAAPIMIDGAILLRLSGKNDKDEEVQAAVMVYVSPDSKKFYLSREAMVQLGIIPNGFPQVGAAFQTESECKAIEVDAPSLTDCDCEKRCLPPGRPTKLPFEATAENVEQMKAWLLERYSASSFNKCPHRPLPSMEGPPLKLHIDPNAKPIAMRTPASVPLHW